MAKKMENIDRGDRIIHAHEVEMDALFLGSYWWCLCKCCSEAGNLALSHGMEPNFSAFTSPEKVLCLQRKMWCPLAS